MELTTASNAAFETCFQSVLEGLLEHHPALRMARVVARLRGQLSPTWTLSGNAQCDYETLRDRVEALLPATAALMDQQLYTVSIRVEVVDEQALYHEALERAQAGGLSRQDADEMLIADGIVNVNACLVQVLDPGRSPAGVQIIDSGALRDAVE